MVHSSSPYHYDTLELETAHDSKWDDFSTARSKEKTICPFFANRLQDERHNECNQIEWPLLSDDLTWARRSVVIASYLVLVLATLNIIAIVGEWLRHGNYFLEQLVVCHSQRVDYDLESEKNSSLVPQKAQNKVLPRMERTWDHRLGHYCVSSLRTNRGLVDIFRRFYHQSSPVALALFDFLVDYLGILRPASISPILVHLWESAKARPCSTVDIWLISSLAMRRHILLRGK